MSGKKRVGKKARTLKKGTNVNVRQDDRSNLCGGNFIVHTSCLVCALLSPTKSPPVLAKFPLDAEVFNIGNKNCILGLFWLMENVFLVNTQERCVRNANSGRVIHYSVR